MATIENTTPGPFVSIIIPAYRVAEFLEEAVSSAVNQTYPRVEVIVVDQDLNEETDRILQPYEDRIVHLRQSKPSVSAARNYGIREAKGELIYPLDGDDVLRPHAVETLIALFDEDPSLDVVYGNLTFIGDSPQAGRTARPDKHFNPPITYTRVASREIQIVASCMGRREHFLHAGLYDESIAFAEDLDIWLRMLHHGAKFGYTTEVVYSYRLRAGQATSRPLIETQPKLVKVYEKQLELEGLSDEVRALLRAKRDQVLSTIQLDEGKRALLRSEYAVAAKSFREAHRLRPNRKYAAIGIALQIAPWLLGPILRGRVQL